MEDNLNKPIKKKIFLVKQLRYYRVESISEDNAIEKVQNCEGQYLHTKYSTSKYLPLKVFNKKVEKENS